MTIFIYYREQAIIFLMRLNIFKPFMQRYHNRRNTISFLIIYYLWSTWGHQIFNRLLQSLYFRFHLEASSIRFCSKIMFVPQQLTGSEVGSLHYLPCCDIYHPLSLNGMWYGNLFPIGTACYYIPVHLEEKWWNVPQDILTVYRVYKADTSSQICSAKCYRNILEMD